MTPKKIYSLKEDQAFPLPLELGRREKVARHPSADFLLSSVGGGGAQSRQSAKLFSGRLNWDSPNPSHASECAPPPLGSGGRGTHAGERGGGRVPIPTRGHRLWYSLYIYVLCGVVHRVGVTQSSLSFMYSILSKTKMMLQLADCLYLRIPCWEITQMCIRSLKTFSCSLFLELE